MAKRELRITIESWDVPTRRRRRGDPPRRPHFVAEMIVPIDKGTVLERLDQVMAMVEQQKRAMDSVRVMKREDFVKPKVSAKRRGARGRAR